MKHMKKLLIVAFALAMCMAMSATVFAAGTNTVTVSGAKTGETYNIYRMLDLSVNDKTPPTAFRYTMNEKWQGFWTTGAGKDYITVTNGVVTWKEGEDTAAKMEAFGKAAAQYAKDNNIAPDADPITAGTVEWTGLDNGYYLVTSTYGIATSVASTPSNPTQTISEKNTQNTTDKDVKEAAERNGTEESWGDSNDAQVGDEVFFRAKVTIAKNSIKVKYHDTMGEALDWTGASKVKVYTDAALSTELAATNYSVAAGANGETFVVTFTDAYVAGLTAATTDVYVSYSGILNDKAVVTTAAPNTGKVTWGDKGESEETTTQTYTRKFDLLKYDSSDNTKKPLAGAKFKLFTAQTGGTALKLAKNAAGTIYRVVDLADEGATLPEGYTLVADDKIVTLDTGNITIEGVDSDDYWLEETDPPEGYNPITGRTKVQVKDDNSLVVEIPNSAGSVLPTTGGMGTTLFYVLGGLLVVGCAILLVARRRTNNNK